MVAGTAHLASLSPRSGDSNKGALPKVDPEAFSMDSKSHGPAASLREWSDYRNFADEVANA